MTGVVNARIGAGARVRVRASARLDSSRYAVHDLIFTGLVTLPI
jgi:hypothetical protein